MYESIHISDTSLLRIMARFEEIVHLTKNDVANILSHDVEGKLLTDMVRERMKSLIVICLLADRLRVEASYPYVLDPDSSLRTWFHTRAEFLEGQSPIEFLKTHPHTGIETLRNTMSVFFDNL